MLAAATATSPFFLAAFSSPHANPSNRLKSPFSNGALQAKANDTRLGSTKKEESLTNNYCMITCPNGLLDPTMLADGLTSTGRLVQDGLVFRQTFTIRSYEMGADGQVSIQTLMNYLQETVLNHMKSIGILGFGFAPSPEMSKRNLIWVINRMEIVVDHYPTWLDVARIDCTISADGKNGLRSDWLVHDCRTGEILTRASGKWVLMNKQTRRMSKIPEEVRKQLKPHLTNTNPGVGQDARRLPRLDDNTADCIHTGLTPKWSDLDINQHVNNVKYISWILRSIPQELLESHKLTAMTVEYRRECRTDSMLQSLTAVSDNLAESGDIECHHLLRLADGAAVVKGMTQWRPKRPDNYINGAQISIGFP